MPSLHEISERCPGRESNIPFCNCTYEPCPRKYICCECLRYHLKNDELPACLFSERAERTYDRSVENFIRDRRRF